MDDLLPLNPMIHEAREVVWDVHHGLRQAKAKGDADALAHILACAREAGATPDDLSQIASGFKSIAEALVKQGPHRRRPPWRRRSTIQDGDTGELSPARVPELPPGPRA